MVSRHRAWQRASPDFLEGLRKHISEEAREQRGAGRLASVRPALAAVIGAVEELKGEKLENFRDQHGDTGRDLVLYLARKHCGLTLDELAHWAGVKEYATVALAVKRFEDKLKTQRTVASAEARRQANC